MDQITIEEVELIFKLIIDRLKKDEFTKVEFNFDEYWVITADEWDNFIETPQPVVGSTIEDVHYLKEAVKEQAIYSYSNLDRMATVLRTISQTQAPI